MYALWQSNSIVRRLNDTDPFTIGNEQFPAGWLVYATVAEKTARNIYPIVYTNNQSDPQYYSNTEGSPSLSGGQVQIAWASSIQAVSRVQDVKTAALRSRSTAALGGGLTIGTHTYPTDPASLQVSRQAVLDVINGATASSFIRDTSGVLVTVNTGNAPTARNAIAKFFYNICNFENNLNTQIKNLALSSDATGIMNLDITSGWPSS